MFTASVPANAQPTRSNGTIIVPLEYKRDGALVGTGSFSVPGDVTPGAYDLLLDEHAKAKELETRPAPAPVDILEYIKGKVSTVPTA